MSIWFTADLHLGHSNIIKYCKRPFANIKEMDEILIENWNSKVKDTDVVYVLGDFALPKGENGWGDLNSYIEQLRGKKFFVLGDHDGNIQALRFIGYKINKPHSIINIIVGKHNICLCHYPIARWCKSHYGSWHLYGHCHGGFQNVGKSFDVGVDCHNYSPISFEEVAELMKNRPDNPNLIQRTKNNA